ncbi:Phosphotransferase enzyme family protein [Paractinoplanes atraurantiacus]|uniref:Phosphotransferase enzyme family protein n=1 Tax=Paractinoplanes atraurantiacus TaxID=1036182 RepID=A0A285F692_9ACTN|nr:Phosphotransferase enzyme family protein [Actinoplanes atraurantiacus]
MRTFLTLGDVSDVVAEALGGPPVALDRLTGGTKKGVYRLRRGDGTTAILYVWADNENYWPPSVTVPDDPFTDASGLELFVANHAALATAGVRVPHLLWLDRDAGLALVEDVRGEKLEALMERNPEAAEAPLAELGNSLRRMHTTTAPRWGRLIPATRPNPLSAAPFSAALALADPLSTAPSLAGPSPAGAPSVGVPPTTSPPASLGDISGGRSAQDVILDRALGHLRLVEPRDGRLAEAGPRIEEHLRRLHGAVRARSTYGLVHGELGPDHVLIGPDGEPVMIDIEGLTYFDVEWEHAFLQLRFGESYDRLKPVELDLDRLEFYRYAQVLALIEGPLRIAETDFPERDWMLQLAEWNIAKALDLPE